MRIKDFVSDDGTVVLIFNYETEKFGKVESIKITYLNGKVEEEISKPNVVNSIGKMITKLISGIIIEVNGKPVTDSQKNAVEELVKSMYFADRDLIMQAHYMFSFSDVVEVETVCGDCGKKQSFEITISEMEVEMPSDDETHKRTVDLDNGLRVGDVQVKQAIVRNPTGIIQEVILASNNTQVGIKNELLVRIVEKLIGLDAFPSRLISELSTKDRNKILKTLEDFTGKVPTTSKSTCINCGSEVSGTIAIEKYFAGE